MLGFYADSSEAENLGQLAFLFKQAQIDGAGFEPYQQLATQCIGAKGFPKSLIANINQADLLTFFTPALQLNWHFTTTNQHQRNVLHYLMLGNPSVVEIKHPPFIYLRSLMLFESNEMLQDALVKRDNEGMTPLELYLSSNKNLSLLPNHEFTAVLALIEFQSNKKAIDSRNYKRLLLSVKEQCLNQAVAMGGDLHRLQLLAAFYGVSVEQLIEQMR